MALTGSTRRRLATLAAIAVLGAVASLPFWQAAPTRSADGLLHLYRLVELDHCLALGSFFPRWTPDLAQGYGFPLFNYYPPLAYYLAEAWHLLGFSLVRALSLAFITSIVLSGASMFLLAGDFAGEPGAVVAALLYMYTPVALYNALYRGGVAEVLAWALAPLVLWAFHRLVRAWRARWLVLASLSYAALLLSHHLSALTFTPLLGLLVLGTWLQDRRRWPGLAWAGVALLLALGVSAFFTMPAFFERGLVQIERVFVPGDFDFHNHFVSWQTLLAGPPRADPNLLNPDIPHAIGWLPLAAGLLGWVGALVRRPGKVWAWYAGALGVAAALVALMLKPSVRIWEAIDLLKYLQFPWRLLAPLSLVLAFAGSGASTLCRQQGKPQRAPAALLLAVTLASFALATPLLYPTRHHLASNPTLADLLAYEREGTLGLTSAGDYLPLAVEQVPVQSPMAAQYAAGTPVTWLDAATLPESATLVSAEYRFNDMELTFDSSAPFQATINQFYFPGWQASVDGAPAAVAPAAPYGVIAVSLPAGRHVLRLRFGATPLRRASELASLCSLVLLAGAAWLGRQRGSTPAAEPQAAVTLPRWGWLLLLAATAAFLGLKAGVLDRLDTPLMARRLVDGRVRGATGDIGANLGNEMTLLGYDLPCPSVAAGDSLPLALYWSARRDMAAEYSTYVYLVDEQGHTWGQDDSWHPGGYPTSRWPIGEYNRDDHKLRVLPGTPPGEYAIRAGAYIANGLRPLDVLDGNGAPVGTSVELGRVQVTRPGEPPTLDSLDMRTPLAAQVNDDLELLGCTVPTDPVHPGQRVRLTLFWRAERRAQADYQVEATLRSQEGQAVGRAAWPVAGAPYPATAWGRGEIIRAQYDLLIPATAPAGANTLEVALAGPGEPAENSIAIAQLDVVAVPHSMDVPEMQHAVGAGLGAGITLLGYDLQTSEVKRGDTLHLRLYWQARQSMDQEYTVFTHLLDATSHISAQQDSAPAQGARPTTGWVVGEVIVDDYQLLVSAGAATGEHQLEVGVYEPTSGRRLPACDAAGNPLGDRVLLGTVQVR